MNSLTRVIDRLTGRVPMYRLLTIVLLAVLLVALLLSSLGLLFYSPASILASTAVAIGVTWGVTRLIALALRVPVHDESSVITGLLLAFLMLPGLDLAALGVTALAAALAAASKFVIAWRGRHLVNPAAFGAFAVSLTGLGGAGWWVATPTLLPVVVIGAVLVLWRTRTQLVGLTFMGAALLLVVPALIGFGSDPLTALVTALGSYPIVFLGAFLLTEPMTLPPRRWQQVVVALVVAVLFALPLYVSISVGTFALNQELAIVVGNLVGAALALPLATTLRFLGSRPVGADAVEYRFAAERPLRRTSPGQYAELHVPHSRADRRGTRRHLSFASISPDAAEVGFAVRTSPEASSFKRRLATLVPGDAVRATWVGGDFVLPEDRRAPVLLVAGGIGVTPFLADLDRGERDAVLIYRVASLQDVLYRAELEASRLPVLLVTPDAPARLPAGWRHAGTLEEALAGIPDAGSRTAYVSGTPSFVDRARVALRTARVSRVRTDRFSGY